MRAPVLLPSAGMEVALRNTYPSRTDDPGARFRSFSASSIAVLTGLRSTALITSPTRSPAFSATPSRTTPVTSAPTFTRVAATIPNEGSATEASEVGRAQSSELRIFGHIGTGDSQRGGSRWQHR